VLAATQFVSVFFLSRAIDAERWHEGAGSEATARRCIDFAASDCDETRA
jgi:hypothetical protein